MRVITADNLCELAQCKKKLDQSASADDELCVLSDVAAHDAVGATDLPNLARSAVRPSERPMKSPSSCCIFTLRASETRRRLGNLLVMVLAMATATSLPPAA